MHHDQSQVISISRQARDELERPLQEDGAVISRGNDGKDW